MIVLGLTLMLVIHRLAVIIYRLYFSPLAKFPGSKLAAATSLYETYFNLFQNGKYIFEIKRMHDMYGPILRVNPYELSICDPDFYNTLYTSGSVRPTNRYDRFNAGIDLEGSHFFTTDHHLHRKRRKPLEPFFSRAGITALEPTIQLHVSKLITRFKKLGGTGAILRLDHAMMCFTADVITSVCCESPTSLLEDDKWGKDWYEAFQTIIKSMPLFEAFPCLITVVRWIPKSVLSWLDPRSQLFNDWEKMAERHILEVKKKMSNGEQSKSSDLSRRPTIFHHLVHHSDLPESELVTKRLVNEAQVLLAAGTNGTARVLDLIWYYILANPPIKFRIAEELRQAHNQYSSDQLSWTQLEQLPYFQAVIKEGLRLSYGMLRRLSRVFPTSTILFQNYTIPPGIPVGMSAYLQHTDPIVYPDPLTFNPERWLGPNFTPVMQHNFVPFAKGSRNCLGMNLAYAEISLVLAAVFGATEDVAKGMELWKTKESDVELVHDFVVPMPRVGTKGIRVIFR